MDDQKHSDPSASQARSRQQESASQAMPRPTSQLSTSLPQPILFAEGEIDILEEHVLTRPRRLRRTRRWLRSRAGRIVVPLLALLIGLSIGLSSILWYGLSGAGPLVLVPATAQGNLIIEADKDFVKQLVRNDIATAGLPGQVENVSVDLDHGAKMVIQGDDVYSVLGVNISRHFTVDVQPYVQTCVLQMRVTSANLGGIPVTSFVQSFEGKVNQQLAEKPSGLPGGFNYCTVGVRTEPGGMFITYKAIPVTATP
jgi:hypothetical protein